MNKFCAGIHILIRKNNQYLLLKRSVEDESDANCWDLPGGGVDFGEQPLDAAVREVKEEAGINIKTIKILSLWAIEHKGVWSIENIILAKYLSGDVTLSQEHSDYKWVNEDELGAIEPKSLHLNSLFKYGSKEAFLE